MKDKQRQPSILCNRASVLSKSEGKRIYPWRFI